MGVVYLQNAVCVLPARPDLVENMQYVAGTIEEMGGSCHLFQAISLLPGGEDRLRDEFRALADDRLADIAKRLDRLHGELDSAASPTALERVEEELKRERISYLRARRLSYSGSTREPNVDAKLDRLKQALDELYRK